MKTLKHLFDYNKEWASERLRKDPDYFHRLSTGQQPNYLWIGCADSRVPATNITGLSPGELFVHRNVANQVVHSDFNCLSVLQYGVEVLKVGHIIVCGHYQCGGVAACTHDTPYGLIDNWLLHINEIREKHRGILEPVKDESARLDRLCELNVAEQVRNVCNTTVVREAWRRGQQLHIHGWIYGLKTGILQDLGLTVTNVDEIRELYSQAVARIAESASDT